MKLYLGRLQSILSKFTRLDYYAVDAGAVSILKAVKKVADEMGIPGTWYVDGWAAGQNLLGAVSSDVLCAGIKSKKWGPEEAYGIAMGQQVDFGAAHTLLKSCQNHEVATLFFSDHWKDISGIFHTHDKKWVFPDKLFLPDQIAYDSFIEKMREKKCFDSLYQDRIEVIPHLGVESSIADIFNVSLLEKQNIRKTFSEDTGCVILLALDPTERDDEVDVGYCWRDVVKEAVDYRDQNYVEACLWIKPHPRQDKRMVAKFCDGIGKRIRLVEGAVEPYIASADEVWGMISVVLVVALKADRPIRSFQPNRNQSGIDESNPYIEPYLVARR